MKTVAPEPEVLIFSLDEIAVEAGRTDQGLDELRDRIHGRELRRFDGSLVVEVDNAERALTLLRQRGELRWVEREQRLRVRRRWVPDDPLYEEQWHLHASARVASGQAPHLGLPEAWDLSLGLNSFGRPVRVAVLDDGFDLAHPDLQPNMSVAGCELVDHESCAAGGSPSFGFGDWHGTQTAGVIAARGDNALGVSGVCPACQILPVRLIHGDGPDDLFVQASALADAIVWAVDHGAAVINASWGPPDGNPRDAEHSVTLYPLADLDRPAGELSQVLDQALDYALRQGRGGLGTLVLFSAGNGNESLSYDRLASDGRVLAIGAVDASGRRATYSDYGPELFAVAPSSGTRDMPKIWTTDVSGADGARPGDYSEAYGGTSAAVAMASGVAALIVAAHPELSAAQVREVMALSARKIDTEGGRYVDGHSPYYGYGLLNAARALRLAERYRDGCTWILELCGNGLDDNCDGRIDEARQCQSCVPDQAREICDGHDNNCDGRNNENFVCREGGRPVCARCQSNVQCEPELRCLLIEGERQPRCVALCETTSDCAEGFVCVDGRCHLDGQNGRRDCEDYLRCHRDETCNGLDDDCNGLVDDLDEQGREVKIERSACTGPGLCRQAVARCEGGTWICARPGAYQPVETRCDGLDNDCDGEADEGCAPPEPPRPLPPQACGATRSPSWWSALLLSLGLALRRRRSPRRLR